MQIFTWSWQSRVERAAESTTARLCLKSARHSRSNSNSDSSGAGHHHLLLLLLLLLALLALPLQTPQPRRLSRAAVESLAAESLLLAHELRVQRVLRPAAARVFAEGCANRGDRSQPLLQLVNLLQLMPGSSTSLVHLGPFGPFVHS